MADLDLSGSSNFVALVYNDQPKEPVDPKVLQERLKKEKQLKKENEKAKRQREKEKAKEDKKIAEQTKRVTVEHVMYDADSMTQPKPPVVEHDDGDEEGGHDKADFTCSTGTILFLIVAFLAAIAIAFLVSFKVTEQRLGGRTETFEEKDGIVHIGALLSSDDDDVDEEVTEGRLPRNIEPLWYNLTTRIYLPGYVDLPAKKERTFENSLLAKFRVVNDSNEIILNSANLVIPKEPKGWILQLEDTNATNKMITVSNVTINATAETVALTLAEPLKSGTTFSLRVSFSGTMDESKSGLYMTGYKTAKGEERSVAVALCEPHYARRILPCLDEPDRKAVFNVVIEHPKGTHALFNGIETGSEPITNYKDFIRTKFVETPKMSTYLFAIVVSDLKKVERKSSRGIPIRAFIQPDLIDNVGYALNVSVKMLDHYEKLFDIPYPLQKLDLVCVRDLTFGAMETWGLMLFHESSIQYMPGVSSPLSKLEVSAIVSHEISHQWFGNLVTMKWWTDIWLNEAFATHCESAETARAGVVPGLDEFFYAMKQRKGFIADSYASARPISTPIINPVDLGQLFDGITYDKGASVVRMLEDVVGQDNFRNGLRAYLKKFAYGNAEHDDLLQSIIDALPASQADIGKDIKPFMRRFTKQNGYPILNVERPDTEHVEISQEWFQQDSNSEGLNKHGARYDHLWDVPLFYEINNDTELTWMSEGLRVPSKEEDLVVLNTDSKGFYRVNYDPRGWKRIQEAMNKNHTLLSDLTRLRLLEDAFKLAEIGRLPYEVPFDLIRYIDKEEDEIPLLSVVRSLGELSEKYGDDDSGEAIDEFILRTTTPMYKKFVDWKFNYTDNDFVKASLLHELLIVMWDSGHPEVANKMLDFFEKDLLATCAIEKAISSQCSKVPPLIRPMAYCEGVRRGGPDEFKFVLRLYENEIVSIERERLLLALKCTRDTYSLKRLYQALIDEEGQGLFKGHSLDENIVLHKAGHDLAKRVYNEFFFENYKKVFKKYNNNVNDASDFVNVLSARSKSELSDVESFLLANPTYDQFEGFAKTVENGRALLNWRHKHSKHIVEELEKRTNRV